MAQANQLLPTPVGPVSARLSAAGASIISLGLLFLANCFRVNHDNLAG
jgi:hypothetical protein